MVNAETELTIFSFLSQCQDLVEGRTKLIFSNGI